VVPPTYHQETPESVRLNSKGAAGPTYSAPALAAGGLRPKAMPHKWPADPWKLRVPVLSIPATFIGRVSQDDAMKERASAPVVKG